MSVEGYYEGEREFRHLLNWVAEFLGCVFFFAYTSFILNQFFVFFFANIISIFLHWKLLFT